MIIAGAVLRADVIGGNDRISTDENAYVLNANRILEDRPFVTFKWAPGTSLMFAAAALLRGYSTVSIVTHAHGVAQYSQLLVEIATLVLVALLAWILAGPWAALLAVVLMATYQPLIDVTRTYLSEPLGGLALIAMIGAICWARKRDLHALILAGIVAGAAGLAREDFAVIVGVIVIGLFVNGWPNRRAALGRALVYGVAALATVTPFVVYASLEEHSLHSDRRRGTARAVPRHLPAGRGKPVHRRERDLQGGLLLFQPTPPQPPANGRAVAAAQLLPPAARRRAGAVRDDPGGAPGEVHQRRRRGRSASATSTITCTTSR